MLSRAWGMVITPPPLLKALKYYLTVSIHEARLGQRPEDMWARLCAQI